MAAITIYNDINIDDTFSAMFAAVSNNSCTASYTPDTTSTAWTAIATLGNIVINGTFTGNANGWTLGGGGGTPDWYYSANTVAHANGGGTAILQPNPPLTIYAGCTYEVTFTTTRTAGSVQPAIGGQNGTLRSTAATFTETITAANTGNLTFTPTTTFVGSVTNVIVRIQNWNSVCYGNKQIVAVAKGTRTIVTSPTGATWTDRVDALPSAENWQSIIYGNSTFIAIANGTTPTTTSIDGITWASGGVMPSTAQWYCLAYGAPANIPTFVVVSTNNSTAAASSINNGTSWQSQTLPAAKNWRSVCYGNGRFIAVSYGTTDVAVSTDGASWNPAGSMPNARNWSSVEWGNPNNTANGIFVAVAYGTHIGAVSTDNGTTWTEVQLAPDLIVNGTFTGSSYGWLLAAGWTYASNQITHAAGGGVGTVTPIPVIAPVAAYTYEVTFAVSNCSAGTITVSIGGTNGTARSTNNTFTENIVATNTNNLSFTPTTTFNGNIDSVSVRLIGNWNCISYGEVASASGLGVKVFTITGFGNAATPVSFDGVEWFIKAISSAANWAYHCFAPIVWNSGDTLTILNNATVTVSTDQTKFWKTITATYGKLSIQNDSETVGKTFYMGRASALLVNAITVGSGLFSIDIDGHWKSLGTGNGTAGQTFISPFACGYIPCLEVETAVAGTYEVWCNVTGAWGPYVELFGKDGLEWCGNGKRGNYFVQLPAPNPLGIITVAGGVNTIQSYFVTFANPTRSTITSSATRVLTFATDGTIVQSGAGAVNWATDNYAVGDILTITSGLNAGTFTVKTLNTLTLTVNETLQAQVANNSPVVVINGVLPTIYPGAQIYGTAITADAVVVNRVVGTVAGVTTLELSAVCATTNTAQTYTLYNPMQAQLSSTIVVGDGTNGNVIPAGRNVRCATQRIADASPAPRITADVGLECYIDMGLACPIYADICLFDNAYLYLNQPSIVHLYHVGFSYQFYLNECYAVDMNYIGLAASPAYWYYSAKWICRDQRYGTIAPIGYTVPTKSVNATFSYIHNAKIKNYHKVVYCTGPITGAVVYPIDLSYTNDSTWENIRIVALNNMRVTFALYLTTKCYRNTFTNLEVYGLIPINFINSDNNVLSGCEYSLSMERATKSFVAAMRIPDDPATGLALVDNTPYYFKVRSFRSWMDRSQYYDSNEYSATAFQGGWLFPDYLSIRPTETNPRSVTLDWVRRDPTNATIAYEIYRGNTSDFTDRSPASRVFVSPTVGTITAVLGSKYSVTTSATRIITFSAAAKTIVQTGGGAVNWATDGFFIGDTIYISGSYGGNNGTFTVTNIVTTTLTVSQTLYDEVTTAGPAPIISVLRITSKSTSVRAFTIAAAKTITVPAGQSWIGVDGFAVGDVVDISGCVAPLNNGTFTINAATATILTVNEPTAAEVTPTSTSATTTRIFTFVTPANTLTASGSSPGSFITDGHVIGDTVYIANSVSNPGPYTITALTATQMTFSNTVVNETCPAGTIVYRLVTITLRAPVAGQRYWYRFRKYHYTNALTACSAPGFFITTLRQVTGGNTAQLTTSVAHGFVVGQSVTITGMNDITYRGTYTIASVPSTTTFTYALTHTNEGSIADTTGLVVMANITSTFRACSNNIVTVTTAAAHKFVPDQSVVITGLGGTGYNGTFKIASVPSVTTFTYALTHGNEGSTADVGGTIANISLFSAAMTTNRSITIPTSTSAAARVMTFATDKTITLSGGSAGSWITDGHYIGETVTVSGSGAGNNGAKTITFLTTLVMTVAQSLNAEVGNAAPVIVFTSQSSVATLTTAIAHGYCIDQTVVIVGVGDNIYNGTFTLVAVPTATSLEYVVVHANEAVTVDNTGKIYNNTINFDYMYYLAGFKFESGVTRVFNLINNIFSAMFMPGLTITGQGIDSGTTVVSIDPSGREMVISKPTLTSTDTIFATTFSTTRRVVFSNIATIYTSAPHNITIGYIVLITNMTDASYNGTYTVTSVPSTTCFKFALTHADESVADTAGTVTVNSLTLNIPAQTGLVVYNLGGIPIGTEVASVDSSYVIRLTAKPIIAIQFASCSFMTYTESSALTSVANYYANAVNFCLYSRTLNQNAPWVPSNITVATNAVYVLPTLNDWTTASSESLTASADNGTLTQAVAALCPNTTYTASIWVRADQTATIPFGVAGRLSWGSTNTDFTATNKWQNFSATAATGAGVTSLNFVIRVNTNTQVIYAGDAMVNLGATPQPHITTTTPALALAPTATPIVQFRTWCRPAAFCGSTGNQGIEINTFGAAPADTYYSEVYLSTTPGFSPTEANKVVSTIAVDTAHFGFSGSNGNILSNITKLPGGGAAAAALGVFYLTAFCENNVIKDVNLDLEYCNSSTIPIIYLLTAAHNNVFHNINFGRGKNYLASNLIYTQSTNSLTGNRFQNIRMKHYDVPIANAMLNSKIKGVASAHAAPLPTGVYPYVLGGANDGVAAAATYQATYGSQFHELYNSATEGILNIVCEDTQGDTKPYVIKAGLPTFTNKGQVELKNATSVTTLSRTRAANVATIVTTLPHKILIGDEIIVSGLGGTGYNGTQVVSTVPTNTSFTYTNAGSTEDVTSDTAGTVTVGDSIEYTWPHRIYGVSGFRKLFPKMLGLDLGTYADLLEGVRVDVSVKTAAAWSAYVEATPANLAAISVGAAAGFYFKFKLTALPFMKYGARTNNFVVGEIIEGAISLITAKVEEVFDNGVTGTVILSGISGTFFPLELIRRQSDDQSRATNVATNTYAMGPSFTSYVWLVQFFTTIDQSVLYPYDAVNLVLNQLLNGSTVGIFDDTDTLLQSGTSTSVYTYTYGWYGTSAQYSYRVRKAGYVEIDVNWATQGSTLTIPVFQTQYRAVVDASAYTGISINGVAKTITVTLNHTHLELYDYAQYWSCLEANIIYQVPLTISVDSKTIIVTSGWTVTVAGASLTDTTRDISGTVIYTSGGSYQDTNEADWENGGVLYYASTFSHTISDGTNPITGAEITYFDGTNTNRTYDISKVLFTSLASDGSGVVTGYVVYKNDSTTYTGHYVKVRQYGFLTSSGTRTVNGFPIVDTITLTTDNFTTHNEAAVSAFTGISVDYGTKLISVTANHTLTEIYEYLKYSDSLSANMDEPDTIATSDGTNYLLAPNWGIDIADAITVTATGKKLVMSGTGTYHLHTSGQFIGTMADATKTRVPVTLTGIVVGSRCRIEVSSDHTTIYNGQPASSTITAYFEHITDTLITVVVRKSSAVTKYLAYTTGSTITATGASISIAQIYDTIVLDDYGSISANWTVDTDLKTITHSSGSTAHTVTELYSWLQDYFDELTYLPNLVPMSASTPTEFNLINGWFIPDTSFKYLTGGAIASLGQINDIRILTLASAAYLSTSDNDIGETVTGATTGDTGKLLDYNNTTRQWWIRMDNSGDLFDNGSETITVSNSSAGGTMSAISVTGESIWANIFTLGSLVSATTLDVYQNDLQITPWWGTGQIDILVKVKEAGTKINNSYLTVLARTYKSLYDHFVIDASSGRNPVPLAAFSDGNNQSNSGIVAAYTGFTFDFGYISKDLANDNGPQPYDCVIECNHHTLQEIYEYLKYVTRSGSVTTLNGVNGEFYTSVGDIRFDYDHEIGSNFSEGELITGTGGAYGHLVSLLDSGTTGTMLLRNVHGIFIDNMAITGVTTSTSAQVNETVNPVVTITPQKQAPFGSFAGGQFFGARGIWLQNVADADANNYQLIDSTGSNQIPANSINLSITDLHVGDRVGVFKAVGDSNIVDTDVYTSDNTANTSISDTFTVTTPIAADTPVSGTLYVVDRDTTTHHIVNEFLYPYSSWIGSVFTLDGVTLDRNYNNNDTAFVPYISTQASSTSVTVNIKYVAGRYVTVRVRKKGIVPFIIKSPINIAGLSISAIRTADIIVGSVPSGIDSDYTTDCFIKHILHTGGTTVYTVNNLYSWLMDRHEEIEHLTHDLPMSAQTPSEYTVATGWYIDETAITFLKSGAITTSGWDATINADGIRVLTFSSDPNTQSSDVNQDVIYETGGPSDSGKLIDYDNDLKKWWVRVDSTDDVFSNIIYNVRINGTGNGGILAEPSETGDDQFSNIYTLGTIQSGTNIYVYQNDAKLTSWWPSGHIDITIETRDEGILIDSGYLSVFARKYGTLYDHFVIDASTGRNPVPLAAFNDANNQTPVGTVSAYTGFTFTFGYLSKDLANGNGTQPYDCVIECDNHTIKEVYEYLKYVTRAGSTEILNGVNGEFYIGVGDIKLDYSSESSGPFVEGAAIASSSGGSGFIVSLIDDGSTGTLLIRNVHGTFLNTDTLTSASTTATINGIPEFLTPSKQAPFGTFAGGQFFGARGIWLENVADTDINNYQLIDSLGVTQAPPSFIYISVSGLESGDVVSVFRTTGNNKIIDKTYLHSDTSANISGSTTFTCVEDIPADTPSVGIIRIIDTSEKLERRYSYTSYTGKVFSGLVKLFDTNNSGLSQNYATGDTAYVPFIDLTTASTVESVGVSFVETRTVYAIVRHKGIVPFDVKGVVSSTGYSLSAIRTTDSIVAP